jgi:hypothetical protein
MAEEARGVVADEVDVAMTVGVDQCCTGAFDERQRKRGVMQDRARAATGQDGARSLVLFTGRRIAISSISSQPVHHCNESTLSGH